MRDAFNIKSPNLDTKIAEGREIAKNKRILIAGMVQNAESRIPNMRYEIERIAKLFDSYRVLILENDSTDDTRNELLQWGRENTNISLIGGDDKMTITIPEKINSLPGGENSWKRIWKMAHLRNILLGDILHEDADYLLLMDMDLDGNIYPEGVLSSIYALEKNQTLNVLCANSLTIPPINIKPPHFYDTYPLILKGMESDWPSVEDKIQHDEDMSLWARNNISIGDEKDYVPVDSCFSGFALYRMSALQNSKAYYSAPPEGRIGCEHTYFNKRIPGEKGVNPNMVIWLKSF